MSFCAVVNCMDGRTQIPASEYLKKRFGADYADAITEPGPEKILAEREKGDPVFDNIFYRLEISATKHKAKGIGVVAHYDCAGNPVEKDEHLRQLKIALQKIRERFPEIEVVGLWINENWKVEETDL